jgi:hypothetical protein
MPMAAISRPSALALSIASRTTVRVVVQISSALCSTQPSRGKCWLNSRCAVKAARPFSSNSMARELVVPWSMLRIYRVVMNCPQSSSYYSGSESL